MKTITLKKSVIYLVLIMISFTACSEKNATKFSDKNPQYAQLAKYTQIAKIINGTEVKAFANITYLNGVEDKKWDDGYQYFLVGIYGVDTTSTKEYLQMVSDGDKALISFEEEKKISQNDPIAKNIPYKNNWALYKIVKFKDIKKQKDIKLRFALDQKNYKDITFIKE